MAASKKNDGGRKTGSTERINIWLPANQIAWLKAKHNISDTVRALITEAMNMEALAQSVKPKKKETPRREPGSTARRR